MSLIVIVIRPQTQEQSPLSFIAQKKDKCRATLNVFPDVD